MVTTGWKTLKSKLITIAATAIVVTGAAVTPEAAFATTGAEGYAAIDARLAALQETQSTADAERILASGGNVQALVDPDTGEVLAAFRSSARALTPVTPGCTTTSACMTSSSGVPYGYTGSGTRTGSWKNIVRVGAGDRRTSYAASNGAAYNYSAGVTISWARPVTVVKISR
ncbi:hypothetical protein GA0004736_2611 [Curtobacterium sp. 9128]|uniref:hypothetical protein n=1 Tax=Curtobacterium sp. 9128 TaxID=1793722 RepID=UPI0007D7105F|nr:hypothetical protein [Curtobacterium sp. 9128]SBN63673.1 hypothetical protein GA0004736_2611 [Curtobacterium sp. 9128]